MPIAPIVASLIGSVAGKLLEDEPQQQYNLGNLTDQNYVGMQSTQQPQKQGGVSTIGSLFDMMGGVEGVSSMFGGKQNG